MSTETKTVVVAIHFNIAKGAWDLNVDVDYEQGDLDSTLFKRAEEKLISSHGQDFVNLTGRGLAEDITQQNKSEK